MIRKAYKYRIYPNKATAEKLQWVLDRCRELYNAALSERRDAWKYAGKSIGYYEQCHSLVEIKAESRPEYQEIGAHVLSNVLKRLDKAYQNFFRRAKNGEKPGYPRFQGRNRYDSFAYPDASNWKLNERKRSPNKKGIVRVDLQLMKIGTVKLHLHRDLIGTVKTLSIKREGEHWYAVFSCEVKTELQYHPSEEETGIDLGLLHFATLADGSTIENPRHYRAAEKKLAKLQQSLARKKRGSHRRRKAVQCVGKAHRKVRNQRADFLHKESRKLVNKYRLVVFENLQAANMSKRPKPKQDEETGQYLPNGASAKAGLNKSILDAGWSQFVSYCAYKAEWAGGKVMQVNPRYTSQICSGCGTVVKKTLDERRHVCSCGVDLDRDHNAAINILRLGQSQQVAKVT